MVTSKPAFLLLILDSHILVVGFFPCLDDGLYGCMRENEETYRSKLLVRISKAKLISMNLYPKFNELKVLPN